MKKSFSIIGIIVGIALIFVGIATMCGGLGGNTSRGFTNPLLYENGYATFGAAFYTYVNNNVAEVSENTGDIVYNTYVIGEFLMWFFGTVTMCFGVLTICGFGIVLSGCSKEKELQKVTSGEETADENFDNAEEEPKEEVTVPANTYTA